MYRSSVRSPEQPRQDLLFLLTGEIHVLEEQLLVAHTGGQRPSVLGPTDRLEQAEPLAEHLRVVRRPGKRDRVAVRMEVDGRQIELELGRDGEQLESRDALQRGGAVDDPVDGEIQDEPIAPRADLHRLSLPGDRDRARVLACDERERKIDAPRHLGIVELLPHAPLLIRKLPPVGDPRGLAVDDVLVEGLVVGTDHPGFDRALVLGEPHELEAELVCPPSARLKGGIGGVVGGRSDPAAHVRNA